MKVKVQAMVEVIIEAASEEEAEQLFDAGINDFFLDEHFHVKEHEVDLIDAFDIHE